MSNIVSAEDMRNNIIASIDARIEDLSSSNSKTKTRDGNSFRIDELCTIKDIINNKNIKNR